jgi:peptidoglycan/LPS O-acetylase OafA/YrhL
VLPRGHTACILVERVEKSTDTKPAWALCLPTSAARTEIMHRSIARLAVVDCLRGIAALVVLVWHFRFFFGTPFNAVLAPFYKGGWVAVDLFFVISGFILTRIYRIDDPPPGYLAHFAIRRFSRIYPLHFITLLVVVVLLAAQFIRSGEFVLYPGYTRNDLWHFILNLALLQQSGLGRGFSFNAPSWSISIEMIANVFLIALICFAPSNSHKRICTAVLAGAIAAKLLPFRYDPSVDVLLRTCLGFTAGCLLALSETDGGTAYGLMWRVPKGSSSDGIFVGCVAILML